MSDEATPKDQNGEWVMPEPVFRSSEGRTPGAKSEAATDEIELEIPPGEETPTDDDQAEVFDETSMNHVRAIPSKPVEPKGGGCAKSAFLTFGIIAFVVIAVIAAAIYFLFYSATPNGNF